MRVVVHVLIKQGVGRGVTAVLTLTLCRNRDMVITNVMSILFLLIIVMVEFIIVALEIR